MKRFEGKVVIVTGAGNGIGLAIAHAYAAEGGSVVVADINESAGDRAVDEIIKSGGKAISVHTDVSDKAEWITGQIFMVDDGLMSGHYSFRGNRDRAMLDGHDTKS